jgi:uncharacterized protein YbjT (DUF2867 family)
MKVILFGATGMIGQGVLRECLLDSQVETVLAIGRSKVGQSNPKLRELAVADLYSLGEHAATLTGYDACLFCLGVSAAGMSEAAYRAVTHDLTVSVASTLLAVNPQMNFLYISGQGADSSEHGRTMWARVKGATENALFRMPFKGAYSFRPGGIQPMHGIQSKTTSYRVLYSLTGPLWPHLRAWFPRFVTSTETLGRAMLRVAKNGAPMQIIETVDINSLGAP